MDVRWVCAVAVGLVGVVSSGAEPPLAALPGFDLSPGLVFVANDGQWPGDTRFLSRGGALATRLEPDGASLFLRDTERGLGLRVRMALDGSSRPAAVEGESPRKETYNFILGQDRTCWASDVRAYSRVVYREVGAGIDLVFHEGPEGALEYDVVVRPGADLASFAVRWDGIEGMRIDADGALVLATKLGELRQPAPKTWQEAPDGRRIAVECRYRILDGERCGFEAELVDAGLPLVIDPVVEWARRLGGSSPDSDWVYTLEVDPSGGLLVGGVSKWIDDQFPGAWDHVPPGVLIDLSSTGKGDSYVGRIDPDSGEPEWLTFLGGSNEDPGITDIALHEDGTIYVTSVTGSADWPVTNGSTFQGGGTDPYKHGGPADACVAALAADGRTLVYSTLVGGAQGAEWALTLLVAGDEVVVAGDTYSDDFPVTPGAFQTTRRDSPTARYVRDLFVVRLRPGAGPTLAEQLLYSTFLGGSEADTSSANSLALRPDGSVALAMIIFSADFPVTAGALQARFGGRPLGENEPGGDGALAVLRLDATLPAGEQLVYSTYFGGGGSEGLWGLAMAPGGTLWLTTTTTSAGLPTTAMALQSELRGAADAFLLHLDPDPALTPQQQILYASYLGGSDQDLSSSIAMSDAGILTIIGSTSSKDFPVGPGSLAQVVGQPPHPFMYSFVARLDPSLPAPEQITAATLLGDGGTQHELYALALLPGDRIVAGGNMAPFSGVWPGFPRFTAPPALDTFKGFVFALRFCEPRAVVTTSGSPASGVTFSAAGSTTPAGTAITRVTWDFGDGTQAEGTSVAHTFGPGRHLVTATVTNDGGCADTATLLLDEVPCVSSAIAPWTAVDIGAAPPAFPSSAALESATLSVCAGASGLGGTADAFHLVHQELTGDGVFTARVEELTGGRNNARAGITLREGLEPGARHVTLAVHKRVVIDVESFSYRVLSRTSAGGTMATKNAPGGVLPVFPDAWLRLERLGNTVVASVSSTGLDGTWTEVTRVDFTTPLASRLLVGLASAGADPGPDEPFQPLRARYASISLSPTASEPGFRRGDADLSGAVDISDAVTILNALFLGGAPLECPDGADVNDDGRVDISDAVADLGYLFLGGATPPLPGPDACGPDATAEAPDLGCAGACS